MLEFKGVGRRFGEVRAVEAVDLAVPRGQMLGVIGRSGAGKSTLLRMVNRLTEPSEGDILWEGRSIRTLKGRALRDWRRRCAMIFQQFNLVPRLDVMTNVLVGGLSERSTMAAMFKLFPPAARADAILELDRLGMADCAFKRADVLSGGMQQRVAIARAMVQHPDLLLADEPVASLDPLNAETVMQALQKINRDAGLTVIVNLHSLDLARRYCCRIVGMAQGRIVFDGPVAALTAEAAQRIYAGAEAGAALEAKPVLVVGNVA